MLIQQRQRKKEKLADLPRSSRWLSKVIFKDNVGGIEEGSIVFEEEKTRIKHERHLKKK